MSEFQPLAYSIPEAVRATGLGRTSLYELIATGRIEARKAGKRTLIPAESLRAFLAALPHADIRTGQHAAQSR